MSQYCVEISPCSRSILFQGNLRKAPQLNKRGRKKWKERFCVLRANKTLECFKTKKAMESSKNPRKMIDLRECINLEVGLEYKDQQHIFSLGTFKRTFFFGAPSDALMLQWVDCIERVKNANDKETIKLLDIGLRKNPVASMKTSQSMTKIAALSSSIPNVSLIGSQQLNGHALKKNDILKEERSPSLPPSSPIDLTKSSRLVTRVSKTETSPKHSQTQKLEHSDDEIHSRQRNYYVNVSPRPPVGKRSQKAVSSLQTMQEAPQLLQDEKRNWSLKEVRSSMSPEVGQKVPPPKLPTRMRKGSVGNDENNPFYALMEKEQVQSIQDKLAPFKNSQSSESSSNEVQKPLSLGMKRSFRYRHITLKKEKPLLMNVEEEPSTDEEETEDEDRPDSKHLLYAMKEFAKSSPNLTDVGISQGKGSQLFPQTHHTMSSFGVSPQTNYSKVTVVGVKVQSCSSTLVHKNIPVEKTKQDSTNNTTVQAEPKEKRNSHTNENTENEVIVLPDRHPSDTFTNCDTISINSLDDILVDPPEMFDEFGCSTASEKQDDKDQLKNADEDVLNRNSTESNDTGYNSSPSYHQPTTATDNSWSKDEKTKAPISNPDKSCVCVPIVFYSKNVWKPKGRGKGLLGVQVCLVEQRSSIVNELLSLKELEGYSVIECEEEHGISAMKTNPDDTSVVETSLEDLEFGFSVVKSTQKDLFNRRVREFNFEVRNLFSSNRKPFSCEVHIKYGNEVIVLPIEVIG